MVRRLSIGKNTFMVRRLSIGKKKNIWLATVLRSTLKLCFGRKKMPDLELWWDWPFPSYTAAVEQVWSLNDITTFHNNKVKMTKVIKTDSFSRQQQCLFKQKKEQSICMVCTIPRIHHEYMYTTYFIASSKWNQCIPEMNKKDISTSEKILIFLHMW